MSVKNTIPEKQNMKPEMSCLVENCSSCEVSLESLCLHDQAWITELPESLLLPFLGLRPGKSVSLVARQRFNGPLVVEVDGRCVAISRRVAGNIRVAKASPGRSAANSNE